MNKFEDYLNFGEKDGILERDKVGAS